MISRRTVLRGMLGGATFSLGLPLLEKMLNSNGTALAAGAGLPVRYGLFFWGNGLPWTVRHRGSTDLISNTLHDLPDSLVDNYTPTTTGKDWALSEVLQPLANHRANINVVTGLEPKTEVGTSPPGQCDGHMRGTSVVLTGDGINPEGFGHNEHIYSFKRATLDQVIAKDPLFYKDGAPRFKSLELGMSNATLHDYGPWTAVSHNGPNALNHPIRDPKKFFDQVFAVAPDSSEIARRSSILDVVAGDARRLSSKLGARDRQRVDEHLTHINEIQRRLKATEAVCSTSPAGPQGDFSAEASVPARLDVMADILVAALRCDISRVFSIAFTTSASVMNVNTLGEIDGRDAHQMHGSVHGGEMEYVKAFTRMHLSAYARLLDRMAADKDVNGLTLLDNSVVFGTSEYGEGYTHSNKEHPVILAGRAGGKLETGWHVRDEGGNLSQVQLTILRALGLPVEQFGFSGGETSATLPFLQA